jgi:large subunit ribosomal protein L17
MRHGRHVKKLGVKTAHRHAMMSNMATSLISVGKIKTTTARAKVVQGHVDRLITLAKRGDLHARRQIFAALRDDAAVKKLYTEIVPELKDIKGGYTKRAFFGRRLGDGASLSVVELNIEKKVVEEPKKKGKEKEEGKATEGKVEKKETKPAKEKKEKKPRTEKSSGSAGKEAHKETKVVKKKKSPTAK